MSGTEDPLNTNAYTYEEKVTIVYRPYDKYTEIGEVIANKFAKYLRQIGAIQGELGYIDELEMLIAEELRRRDDVTKESINKASDT